MAAVSEKRCPDGHRALLGWRRHPRPLAVLPSGSRRCHSPSRRRGKASTSSRPRLASCRRRTGMHRVAGPRVKSRGLSPLPVARFGASAEPAASCPMAGRRCLRISNATHLTSGPHIRTSINIEYFRINADRWIDGSDRSIELLVAMQDEAAIEVGGGNARIELDGLIEIGNRPIMAALLVPD